MRAEGLNRFCSHHHTLTAAEGAAEGVAPSASQDAPSRRGFLAGAGAIGGAVALAAGGLAAAGTAEASSHAWAGGETPIGAKWWPSRWGADDEAGASNWMTPAKLLEAVKLIRTGRTFEMGRTAEQTMPLFGDRGFLLRIVGSPTGGPFGDNRIVWNDEFLSTEIGQVGTCLDGLGHIGCQLGKDGDLAEMRFYNGFSQHQVAGAHGLKKLGIEKVKPFFTRGFLIDIAGLKGRMLEKGEEIALADVRAALARQGLAEGDFQPGDAFFFHTGWGALWMNDNPRYNDGEPGIGLDVARWLVAKEACLAGCDNWGCEAVPNPDPKLAFPCHHELITRNGIFIYEGLSFAPLLQDKIDRFAFVMTPLQIKGATGSISRPLAIV